MVALQAVSKLFYLLFFHLILSLSHPTSSLPLPPHLIPLLAHLTPFIPLRAWRRHHHCRHPQQVVGAEVGGRCRLLSLCRRRGLAAAAVLPSYLVAQLAAARWRPLWQPAPLLPPALLPPRRRVPHRRHCRLLLPVLPLPPQLPPSSLLPPPSSLPPHLQPRTRRGWHWSV